MNSRTKATESVYSASFADWAKDYATNLSEDEIKIVKHEVGETLQARKHEFTSKEAIGSHLRKLREILEPKRIFVSSVKYFFNMSRATAYRYMGDSEIAQRMLPGPVYEAAIDRGVPLKKEVIEKNPPPQTDDPQKISAYLDTLVQMPQRRPQAALETDEEVLAKEIVNFVGSRIERVRASGKDTRQIKAFAKRVVGMILTKAGIDAELKLTPIAIPESFIVHRGAPRKEQPEKVAA